MAGARLPRLAHGSQWPYPRVIVHRCGGSLAPENTLAAMRVAKESRCSGVEFDVMLSRDAVPVLMHDQTLDRTTDASGNVAAAPWQQLATLDAGSWFGAAFAGEPLPRYADAARLCIDLGLWANVEIKPAAGFERETGKLVAAMSTDLWRTAPVAPLLSSFSTEALDAAAGAAPAMARGLLVKAIPTDWRDILKRFGCVSLHCEFRHLSPRQARAVKDAGYALVCYTVNDPATAKELFGWGVDALITDRHDLDP
jgi:glycerophosphoryl diester phosphodiesterase